MQAAMYRLDYQGSASSGGACLYLGNDRLLGLDMDGNLIEGTYAAQGGTLQVQAQITIKSKNPLVTGANPPIGSVIPLVGAWPQDFAGQQLSALVGPQTVKFTLSKIGDL